MFFFFFSLLFLRTRIVFGAHHVFFSFSARMCFHECVMNVCVLRVRRCVHKNGVATAPAESGYPCGAWLGRHSEIDVILITREVAYHKGPGPVRPFVLCTRVAIRTNTHTHTRTLFPIDRLSLTLLLLHSLLSLSPLGTQKTIRR